MDVQTVLNKLEEIQRDLQTKASSEEIRDVLAKLNQHEQKIVSLETKVEKLNADIKSRDETVSKMEERVDRLEHEIRSNETKRATLEHLSYLNERKIDDQEQVSRKINLRINGIPIKEDETTTSLLGTIKAECERAGVIVDANDFDHCHRNGRVMKEGNGTSSQSILLKMKSWAARDRLYQNRKKFSFKIGHDLTARRRGLLTKAYDLLKSDSQFKKVVAYPLADKNCKLKLKATNGKYFHFNSEAELFSTYQKLLDDINLPPSFSQDEKDETFY